jgi:hypothetical protein
MIAALMAKHDELTRRIERRREESRQAAAYKLLLLGLALVGALAALIFQLLRD